MSFLQYGVKISLITSFKDTCFIEITPTEQKSERGIYICALARAYTHEGIIVVSGIADSVSLNCGKYNH